MSRMLAGAIVAAVFAIGLGYLLGSWMINDLAGDPLSPVAG